MKRSQRNQDEGDNSGRGTGTRLYNLGQSLVRPTGDDGDAERGNSTESRWGADGVVGVFGELGERASSLEFEFLCVMLLEGQTCGSEPPDRKLAGIRGQEPECPTRLL